MASSNYAPIAGDRFFLLSESTYTSDDVAVIRFDGPMEKYQSEEYDGVDIRVYKISNPLEFLSKQKDLHRPTLKGNYQGEGLSNAFNYLWDRWFKVSRIALQNIFSLFIREKVVAHNANLHQGLERSARTHFKHNPQFQRVSGFEVVEEFRYPFWDAKSIQPPEDTKLPGSSSGFIAPKPGNVHIPLGKLKPGLYFVEAFIGSFRASTIVFVSNAVAVTKTSSDQELVWTADKKTGRSIASTKILITDGVGTKAKGETNSSGLFIFNKESKRAQEDSEVTYVLGEDKDGGVFVSENFFYESEFKDTKMYIFTDRPLYNPGDIVQGKIFGKFKPQKIPVDIIDASGNILVTKNVNLDIAQMGGEFKLQLPTNSIPGGYTIEAHYEGRDYVSAFRVANYVKPPFEVSIQINKKNNLKPDELGGTIVVTYANGRPVSNAEVEVEIKKQKLTIVSGDLQYLDRFPMLVNREDLKGDAQGKLSFKIPPADVPTRYVIIAKAKDKSLFKVAATKELLINIVENPLNLTTDVRFTKPNESLKISIDKKNAKQGASGKLSWETIRLQDQSRIVGDIGATAESFSIKFPKAGNYTVLLKDDQNRVVSTMSHVVIGQDLSLVTGTVSIIFDKDEYNVGDTAKASMIFSEPVDEALLTFEREKVEGAFLLSSSSSWYKIQKQSEKEYNITIPVKEDFQPNIIFSVAYVKNGKYFFSNAGIKVAVSTISLEFQFDKKTYAPGEQVNVTLKATKNKKPIETVVSVGVVDEMIYTLQPEITPDITEFFYHPVRNEVRTNSSLNFHTYDAATSATGIAPSEHQYERKLKLRERPRRDEKDTAFWQSGLKTNNEGLAKFNFVMPDSLTRWRVQARAFSTEGATGSRKDFIYSEKPAYLKWVGPKIFRFGDETSLPLTVYNMTDVTKNITLKLEGTVFEKKEVVLSLSPGPNFTNVSIKGNSSELLKLSLWEGKSLVDRLEVDYKVRPNGWPSMQTLKWTPEVSLSKGTTPVMLTLAQGSGDSFFRATDYLIDYPFGCVEQTSSRLLPLALAYNGIKQFGQSTSVQDKIENILLEERTRLIQLAGSKAQFSWWGSSAVPSSFVTIYAYYADYITSQALGLKIQKEHWENALKVFRDYSADESLHQRVLEVWMIGQLGLPIKTLAEGILAEVSTLTNLKLADPMTVGSNDVELATIYLMSKVIAHDAGLSIPGNTEGKITSLLKNKAVSESTVIGSLLLLNKKTIEESDIQKSNELLDNLVQEQTTIQRALTLAFLYKKIGSRFSPVSIANNFTPGKNWTKSENNLTRNRWHWKGNADSKLDLNIPKNYSAHLLVEKFESQKSTLPLTIKRNFYKLTRDREDLLVASAAESNKLDSSEMYLDEVIITPAGTSKMNYGVIQIPLPPGASVEKSSWGTTIRLKGNTVVIDEKGSQEGTGYYSAAMPKINAEVKSYQLIRFSTQGRFNLPSVRYFKMYAPEQQAFSNGDNLSVQKITVN